MKRWSAGACRGWTASCAPSVRFVCRSCFLAPKLRLCWAVRGPVWLMASLMYGGGLRLLECAELRVKDLSFDRGELTIRDGKGGKDRLTLVPLALQRPLLDHLARVKAQHEADLAAGRGAVALPGALRSKYPNAPREWVWQWVFPATRFYL